MLDLNVSQYKSETTLSPAYGLNCLTRRHSNGKVTQTSQNTFILPNSPKLAHYKKFIIAQSFLR